MLNLTRHESVVGPRWALDGLSLEPNDRVRITIGELTLENPVER